jgi:hypothetical protein
MFSNLDFRVEFPRAYEIAIGTLGTPVVWDVALISLAPAMLAVWSSFFNQTNVPDLDMSLQLADVLDPAHTPRNALRSDTHPNAEINVITFPMRRYVAVDNTHRQQAIRDGSGLVELRSSPRHYERPSAEELERIIGFQTGDTNAHDLPHGQRKSLRTNWLGRCFDVRAMTHTINELPWSPVIMEREGD